MSAAAITCPVCGRTSYHPVDARVGWCSYCEAFTRGDSPDEILAIADVIEAEGAVDTAAAVRYRVRKQALLS